MGLNWHIPLPGPFSIGGPVFPRGPLLVWRHPGCRVEHRTRHAADACRNRPPAVLTPPVVHAGTRRTARDLVVACGFASRGLLQRQLGVGLREADEILAGLERDQVIKRADGTEVWRLVSRS